MTANEEFVKDTFVRFNAELFKAELPMPRIRLSRASSFLGMLQYKVSKIDWHVTRHPYFSRYPHVRSVKMYLVPRSEIIASGAIPPRP